VSFILDALRKSEHERQRSALPGLAQVPLATPPPQVPRWAFVVIGVLLAAVLVLGGAWWQSTRAPVELAAAPPLVERPVPLPTPTVASPPASTALADRAATQPTPPQEPAISASGNGLARAAAPTSTTPPAEELSFADSPAASRADEPPLPSVVALLAEGVSLPELRLELLAFRDQPRDRFVFINGRKYVEGDRLVEGPQLQSIAPTGAVLVYAGRRFLLAPQ
jgi:general secretion pathway protein B